MRDRVSGFKQAQVVPDPAPRKGEFVAPLADPHDVPQRAVVFSEVLQPIIVEIAAEPHGGQDQDVPVVETLASSLRVGLWIHVLGDQLEDGVPHGTIQVTFEGFDFRLDIRD